MKSYLEQAFGRGGVTSARMQAAIREWLNLYYGTQSPGEDAADRLAVPDFALPASKTLNFAGNVPERTEPKR